MEMSQDKNVWSPIEAPWYDQKEVCPCEIAMGYVPTANRWK